MLTNIILVLLGIALIPFVIHGLWFACVILFFLIAGVVSFITTIIGLIIALIFGNGVD